MVIWITRLFHRADIALVERGILGILEEAEVFSCRRKCLIIDTQQLQCTNHHSILLSCQLKSHAAASVLKNFNIRHYKNSLSS